MLCKALTFIDSPLGKAIRLGYCVAVGMLLLLVMVANAQQLPEKTRGMAQVDAVAVEHRFTTVEVELADLIKEVQDLKFGRYVELLSMAGLLGEAGIRMVKKK